MRIRHTTANKKIYVPGHYCGFDKRESGFSRGSKELWAALIKELSPAYERIIVMQDGGL